MSAHGAAVRVPLSGSKKWEVLSSVLVAPTPLLRAHVHFHNDSDEGCLRRGPVTCHLPGSACEVRPFVNCKDPCSGWTHYPGQELGQVPGQVGQGSPSLPPGSFSVCWGLSDKALQGPRVGTPGVWS